MRWVVLLAFFSLCFITLGTTAKKEKPLSEPFPREVVEAIRCDVCIYAMRRAYATVKDLVDTSVKTRVRMSEDDVLTAIEEMCLPLSSNGQWIRRLAIDAAKPLLKLTELPVACKCKRTCSTVTEACEAVFDDDDMDSAPAKLLRLAKFRDADEFVQETCGSSHFCTQRRGVPSSEHSRLLEMIKRDVPEEIDPKEMEIERMMDQMERKDKKRHDIFTRDEVERMQKGLMSGDRESIAHIDPSVGDLSDEEFAEIGSMLRQKENGGSFPVSQDPDSDL